MDYKCLRTIICKQGAVRGVRFNEMAEDLPTEYDVIIIGTGMVEAIVAASVSRIGKRVLHLDPNSYYGHHWATFNFDNLENWCNSYTKLEEDLKGTCMSHFKEEGITLSPLGSPKTGFSNVKAKWFVENLKNTEEKLPDCEKTVEEGDIPKDETWNQHKIRENSRKFNIDLVPKFLFAKGEMVDLLIKSQVSWYTEFVNVTNILVPLKGRLEPVPCSKSDIFLSQNVSVVNKRILMRMLMTCLTCEDDFSSLKGFENKTFYEYLEAEKIPEELFPYLFAISMSTRKSLCSEAVKQAQRFLASLGCYGNTPFLWPLYGSSELLQAYCRLCAVYGGIYYLGKHGDALALDATKMCVGVLSDNQLLNANHVVMSVSLAPTDFLQENSKLKKISRGILITNNPLYVAEKEGVSWFRFVSESEEKEVVNVIELSASAQACPKGLFIVHLSCNFQKGPEEDFKECLETFFEFGEGLGLKSEAVALEETSKENQSSQALKPKILYSLCFEVDDTSVIEIAESAPPNVHFCSGPNFELDFDTSIEQAKDIFGKMYPNENFLLPPPNVNEE